MSAMKTDPAVVRLRRPEEVAQKKTFCGICEASCGLIATVDQGSVTALRPDPSHPSSAGFACSKGVQFNAVVGDPDRVLHPLKRRPDGSFEKSTWDEALADIGRRLRAVQRLHGNESFGIAFGNAMAWNFTATVVAMGLAGALGTKHYYTSGSVDINNYYAAQDMLYGDPVFDPMPDFKHTDFALIVGANPVVSHGSLVTTGQIREVLLGIPERSGRVVVVDPRRTETAELFEHVPILPGADVWLLGAMLRVILDEDRVCHDALALQATGLDGLRELAMTFDLDRASRETRLPREQIVQLARDFASARTACAYGRCGASLGRYSTLTKFLLDCLNVVTGNLDRRGGMVLGHPMFDAGFGGGGNNRGKWRTRVDGVAEINGTAPMACLAREITTPGPGRLRALITCSSNLAMSGPGSTDTASALGQLDLMVSLDPYVNDTSRHADWILPPTLWLEREQMPIYTHMHSTVPNAQWVAPVVAPRGEARDDWWILDQIGRKLRLPLMPGKMFALLNRIGIRPKPWTLLDVALRTGPYGDLFGLRRRGLSRKKLMAHQGAVKLADECPTGVLSAKIKTPDKLVHLDQPEMLQECLSLQASSVYEHPDYPLRLFSIREYRQHNTWLMNVPKLAIGDQRRCRLEMHPDDAEAAGVDDRGLVAVESPWGRVDVTVELTDRVCRGSVGLPHGWGHTGGWKLAVAQGGANYNTLCPTSADQIDQPSGNAFLNGIPVAVRMSTKETEWRM
jgi:formate dehydrogenase